MKSTATDIAILVCAIAAVIAYSFYGGSPHALRTGVTFAVFGYLVGAYGTMVGAGGGFLVVPALLIVYHATPAQAAGTGLSVAFLNAASGTVSYARQKRVDYRAGAVFAGAALPGAVAGAFMAQRFSGPVFDIVFAFVLLGISMLLIFRPAGDAGHNDPPETWEPRNWYFTRHLVDAEGHTFHYRYNWLLGAIISFCVGFLASVLGLGGGIIHVPVLIYVLGFPPHLATATSHFILAITAGVGMTTHIALGHVMMWPALLMGIGVIGGAQVGAVLAKKIHGKWLMRFLALALVVVAIRLFIAAHV